MKWAIVVFSPQGPVRACTANSQNTVSYELAPRGWRLEMFVVPADTTTPTSSPSGDPLKVGSPKDFAFYMFALRGLCATPSRAAVERGGSASRLVHYAPY